MEFSTVWGWEGENNNVNIRILSTYYSWQVSFIKVVIAQRRKKKKCIFCHFLLQKRKEKFKIILDLLYKMLQDELHLAILATLITIGYFSVSYQHLATFGGFGYLLLLELHLAILAILATYSRLAILST